MSVFIFALAFNASLSVKKIPKDCRVYVCVWEDGSQSEESFASAYDCLVGTDGEYVLLSKEGVRGRSEFFATQEYRTLRNGDFGELITTTITYAVSRLDRAALLRTFSDTLWFAEEYYEWTGKEFERTDARVCTTLICLDGDISSRMLSDTQATNLVIHGQATVTASAIRGSALDSITALPPYCVEGGALYLDTAGGRRLIAAVPCATELSVDADFCDEGALLSAGNIERLSLPFAGNAPESNSSYFCGEFAYVFSDGRYRVPDTLKIVCIRGGSLVPFAFYACPSIEEVNACGVEKNAIAQSAFVSLTSLKKLHTPRADVFLPEGRFASYVAECGCTVYERI